MEEFIERRTRIVEVEIEDPFSNEIWERMEDGKGKELLRTYVFWKGVISYFREANAASLGIEDLTSIEVKVKKEDGSTTSLPHYGGDLNFSQDLLALGKNPQEVTGIDQDYKDLAALVGAIRGFIK